MASRSFGTQAAKKPHLVQGKGGVAGEVDDLRGDVEAGFTALEAEIDSGGAAAAVVDPVRLATDAALNACTAAGSGVGKTLTQDTPAVENIDGQAVVAGDRILVKDQVAGEDNGIYTVTTVGTVSVAQVLTRATDFDSDSEVVSGAFVRVNEGTANADTAWLLTTNDPITVDTDALVFAEPVAVEHAASHITGAGDEIDGDQVDIDLTPSNYTPDTTPAEVTDADHLGAHLAGVDNELADVAQAEGSAAAATLIQAGQPTASHTLTVGSDVYEADGAGANINFVIAGSAEATMDNLLAAAQASGTENLKWDKLDATHLRIRNADAPDGNVLAGDQSIALDASSMANYSFDVGDVNMNTLAGLAGGTKQVFSTAVLTITTAMITATEARISFPFTPASFTFSAVTSAGVPVAFTADTIAISGDDIELGLGTDLANGDILTVVAFA